MLQLKHPGVYIQEIPSGVRTITGASTSVALFAGPTLKGEDLIPRRIFNYGDFERSFGGLSATSNLSYSVLHFFANGGGEAWVLRIPANNAAPAAETLRQEVAAGDQSGAAALVVTALSSGAASNELFIEVDRFGIGADPFGAGADRKRFNLTVTDRITGTSERWVNLSTTPTNARFAPNVINDPATGSKLVKVAVSTADGAGPQSTGTIYKLAALPAAGTFAKDVALKLTVDVYKADGSVDANASVANLPVTVFAKTEAKPTSLIELATRLAAAINQAIRASAPDAAKMQDVDVVAEIFEGGKLLRLRTEPPGLPAPTGRVMEARVDIAAPAAGPDSFLATFLNGAAVVSNPSRYQMGSSFGATAAVMATPTPGKDGDANGQPSDNAFMNAILSLDAPDPFFNLLCLPDLVRPSPTDPTAPLHANAMTAYAEAARICRNKHAFLLIDPLPSVSSVGAAESWKTVGFTFQSNHAAAYFPNIRVDDPLVPGAIRAHPPSGAVAGLIARTDGAFGVWQAPAGTEASLSGVYGPSIAMSDKEQGILNPIGVNCIRQFPIFGTVCFGSRTVDGSDALASDWKYVPVRRTAAFIELSLFQGLKWAVHKANGPTLWAELRMNVTSFMHGLFRQGAFKGVSAREAYFVLCDASTTSQADIDAGIVNIVVGFAPLKPAEFVVVSVRQIVQAAAA